MVLGKATTILGGIFKGKRMFFEEKDVACATVFRA